MGFDFWKCCWSVVFVLYFLIKKKKNEVKKYKEKRVGKVTYK